MGFFEKFGFGSGGKKEISPVEKVSEASKAQVTEQTGAEKERQEAEVLCSQLVSSLGSIVNDKQYALYHPDFAIRKIGEARKQIEIWSANPVLEDLSSRVRAEMDKISGDEDFREIFDEMEAREAYNLIKGIRRDNPIGGRVGIHEKHRGRVALQADKLLASASIWKGNSKLSKFALDARDLACDLYKAVGNNEKVAEIEFAEAEKLKEQYLRGLKEDYLPTKGLIRSAREYYTSAANNFHSAGLFDKENVARATAEEIVESSYGLDPKILDINEEMFPPDFFPHPQKGEQLALDAVVRRWLNRIQEKQANVSEDSQGITEKATIFSESLKECLSLCERLKLEAGEKGHLDEDKLRTLAEAINKVSESFYSLFYADKDAEKWGFDLKYGFYDNFKGYLIHTQLIKQINITIVFDKEPFDTKYMVTDSSNDSRISVSSVHSWAIEHPSGKPIFKYAKVDTKVE